MLMWWRIQQDDDRRVWAERMLNGDPADAKRHHAQDKKFNWADGHNPTVSPLEFYDDQGRTSYVASGFARETDEDRKFRTGGTPTTTSTQPPTPTVPPPPAPDTDHDLPFGP